MIPPPAILLIGESLGVSISIYFDPGRQQKPGPTFSKLQERNRPSRGGYVDLQDDETAG